MDGAPTLTDDEVRALQERVTRLETELEALREHMVTIVREEIRTWGTSLSNDLNENYRALSGQMNEIRDILHGKGIENGIKGQIQGLEARIERHAGYWRLVVAIPATVVAVVGAIKALGK